MAGRPWGRSPTKAGPPLWLLSQCSTTIAECARCRAGPPEETMFAWFRAGLVAALFVFVTTPSPAAPKTFQDDALDDAAVTLEADLKDEAGTVEKPVIKLKQ